MGRSRRKAKELDPEVLKQREEVWDKQRGYLLSESERRLKRELDSKKRSLSSGSRLDPFSSFEKVARYNLPPHTPATARSNHNMDCQQTPERRVVYLDSAPSEDGVSHFSAVKSPV